MAETQENSIVPEETEYQKPTGVYPQSGQYQSFKGNLIDHLQGDKAVKLWFLFGVLWFAFFTTFGFILAIKFFYPTFAADVSWFTFGVVRPAHTNGVLFGFVTSGLLGGMFYIVPRLCAVPLYRPRVAILIPIFWNAAVLAGIIWILLGGSQGREYAELPWAIDVAVILTLLLMAYVILGTIKHRNEKKLYGSIWYYAGTMIWFPVVYFIGNVMWNPPAGALNGIRDAIFNWYYGHNVLGLWFTTLGIPAIYYLVPKLIKRPLYSHLLSIIGFFSIAFFYTGVGAHHLLQAPIPEWLKTIAVIMTVLMLVPVLVVSVNISLTMRGSWRKLPGNPVLMFVIFGWAMYIVGSVQGTFQGLRISNAYLHFSQWTVSHSHITLLGAFGFLAAALAFYVVPNVLKSRLFNNTLLTVSWWTTSIGTFFFFWAMVIAGLIANANWWSHINVVETLPALRVPFIFRAIAGGVVVVGAYMVAINIIGTFIRKQSPVEVGEYAPARALTSRPHSKRQRHSQQTLNLYAIITGGVGGFIVMTFMVIAMPYMFAPAGPSQNIAAHPLTVTQETGENIYKANGCFYCHNQFVRDVDWAMGEVSEPGDFYYSIPNFFGTERTGPTLGTIGGKRPTEWHKLHDTDPRSVSPSSIMPPFSFLSDQQLASLVDYIQNLGGEDLETRSFQPTVPLEFRSLENPNLSLLDIVQANYDPNAGQYNGPADAGTEWAALFNEGKILFTQKCLSCHSCAGNGQGPYARQTLAHPANLHERISNFPDPKETYHNWRVNTGVPGTAMPPWGWSLDQETIWKIATYEMSFINGSIRTVSGDVSDAEGDKFNDQTLNAPPIAGTQEQYIKGQNLFMLFCAVCHGQNGKGDGPASIKSPEGYINPVPANFAESGSDFKNYGRWVWKVKEGVETTNMPPWKEALSSDEIYQLVFYIQTFSVKDDYTSKWAPLYSDQFAKNIKEG